MATLEISYRRIFAIAIPVIIGNFLLPLQSLIDTAVVGHFNSALYLAGMAIALQCFTLITVSFNFIQYATSGLSAQLAGSFYKSTDTVTNSSSHTHNNQQLLSTLQRSLCIAFILSVFILIFHNPIIDRLGALFFSSAESHAIAQQYLNIRIWGLIPELMSYAFIGFFAGTGQTKQILYYQLFVSFINISTTLLLVYGFMYHIEGVALATVIAQWIGLVYAGWLTKNMLDLPYRSIITIVTLLNLTSNNIHAFKQLFNLNINIFIRTLLLVLSFAWITKLSAQAGELVLATNIILLQVLTISAYMLDGVAISAETLTGQCVGNKNWQGFTRTIKMTALASYGFAIALSIVWMILFPYYLTVMTELDTVYVMAHQYKWYAILLPIIGVGAYWLDGILFGLVKGSAIRNVSFAVTGVFLPCSILLTQHFNITGIWLSVWLLLLLRFFFASIAIYRFYRQTTAL